MNRCLMYGVMFALLWVVSACGGQSKSTKTNQSLTGTAPKNFYPEKRPAPTPANKIRRIPGPRGITYLIVDGDYRTSDSDVVFPAQMASYKRGRGMEMTKDRRNAFFAYQFPGFLLTSYVYPSDNLKKGVSGAADPQTFKPHFGSVLGAIQTNYQQVKIRKASTIKISWRGNMISAWYAEIMFHKRGVPMISWAVLGQHNGWFIKHRISTEYKNEAATALSRKEALNYIDAFGQANNL